MQPIEIIVIIAAVSFVLAILTVYIKRRIKGEPTGDCACCHTNKEKLLKKYHKMYGCKCVNK